jgi:glycosyltransferase involved in cell wall biosynthesis
LQDLAAEAMPGVSVLVPTHSHGPLLGPAVRSALRQTREDLEVLIVGDGATESTRACAEALAAQDERVRFFPFEKGERHGELSRHRVLAEQANGDVVLYLSDDDLWLPEHVAHMLELLENVDFAHALSTWILPDGTVQATVLDLSASFHREAVREGRKTPTLTACGHTAAAYRQLPHGWRTTPEGISTDSWMWRQFLEHEGIRAASGMLPTIIHLPTPPRRDWSLERRLAELERYEHLGTDLEWRRRYVEALLEKITEESAWFWGQCAHLEAWGHHLEAWGQRLERELAQADAATVPPGVFSRVARRRARR